VDDDIAEITAVKRALLRAGAQAQLATSAREALAAIAAERPVLVIVASDCEDGEALALARQLAAGEGTRDLPLLLLGEPDGPAPARVIPRPVDAGKLAEDLAPLLDGARPAPSGPAPPDPRERRAAAEALRARAEELRRAGAEERERREAEVRRGREADPALEARRRAEEDLRRLLAAEEAEEALEALEQEVGAPLREAEEAPAPEPRPAPPASTPPAPPPPSPAQTAAAAERARQAAEEEARRRASSARARRTPEPPPPRAPEAAAPPRAPASPGTAPGGPAPRSRSGEPAPARTAVPVPHELAAGSLADVTPARLLALAFRARLSGRLDFGGSAPRSLYFEEGRIVGATSAAPAERVEEVALRLGLVTRDQHRQAAPACAGLPSRRAALVLLQRGFLKAEELTGLVRRRTEEVVFALFAEPDAPFRHAAARPPPEERTALDRSPLSLAVEGVRRRWREDRLALALGGPATLLGPAALCPTPAELALGEEEERLLQLADGLRTLDEIASDSPLDPLSTRQVLAALVEVGALEVRIRAGAAARAADPEVDLARLQEKLEQVRRADYFTILGLSRTATPYEIRASAQRLLAELDPDRWAGVGEPGVPERLAEVRQVVDEARQVLTDDELRAAYLQGLQ
jgi:CheY-like chemotaxis protein